jgi:RNA polymerase sigma-70 factor (ECF subfamily)
MSRNFLIEAYQMLRRRSQYNGLHDSEDALNDAFCQLWGGSYDPASVLEGEKLLSTAAHRRQISFWRRETSHPKMPLDKINIVQSPPDTDVHETYVQVKTLIESQLTPLQKEILTRHDINDETYKEIAQDLRMQEAAVRMQLSRARNIIRETYKKSRK